MEGKTLLTIILISMGLGAATILVLLFGVGLLSLVPGQGTQTDGSFVWNGQNVYYDLTSLIGRETIVYPGSGDSRSLGINNIVDYSQGLKLESQGFETRAELYSSRISGSHFYQFSNLKTKNLKQVSFMGNFVLNERLDATSETYASLTIGIKDELGIKHVLFTFRPSRSCTANTCAATSISKSDFKIIRDSFGWTFTDNIGASQRVDSTSEGTLYLQTNYVYFSKAGNFDLFKISLSDIKTVSDVLPVVDKPKASFLQSILSKWSDWVNAVIAKLKGESQALSIAGSSSVTPGTIENYHVALNAPTLIDSDYNDGTMQVRYCNIGLIDDNGKVLSEKGAVECMNNWTSDYSVMIPLNFNNNAIIAVMTEFDGTFNVNTQTWSWSEEKVVQKEAYSLESKAPVPAKPLPNPLSWFNAVIDWIKSLFRR